MVARGLWEWATGRQLFITLEKSGSLKPIKTRRSPFSRSHTFTFAGRCRREVLGRPTLAATMPNSSRTMTNDDEVPSSSSFSQSLMFLPNEADKLLHETGTDGCPLLVDVEEKVSTIKYPQLASSGAVSGITAISEPTAALLEQNVSTATNDGSEFGAQSSPLLVPSLYSAPSIRPEALVPFFKDLPKHRYTAEAEARQQQLVAKCARGLSGVDAGLYDEDDAEFLTESAVSAMKSAVEEGEAWAAEQKSTSEVPLASSSPKSSWFSLGRTTSNPEEPVFSSRANHVDSRKNSVGSGTSRLKPSSNTMLTQGDATEEEHPVSIWRAAACSVGVLAGLSAIGLALVFELEVHSPVIAAIRGSPWLSDMEMRYYRPVRSALLGFLRR